MALVALIAIVALIGAVTIFEHWRHDLRLLDGYGNGVGSDSQPMGRPMFVPMVDGVAGRPVNVHLTSARADVARNTSHAQISVLLCHLTPGTLTAVGEASSKPYCSSVEPFHPGTYRVSEYNDGHHGPEVTVMLEVVPMRAGETDINGLLVGFEQGIRTGTQRSGFRVTVHTPRS